MSRDKNTGLVRGCRKATLEELLSVVSCKRRFTLAETDDWIPDTTIKTIFKGDHYSMSFYIHFPRGMNKWYLVNLIFIYDLDIYVIETLLTAFSSLR